MSGLLHEIGDPVRLQGKDKLYSVQPASQGNFFVYRSEETPLPVPLEDAERLIDLMVGPDAGHPEASFRLRLWTHGGEERPVWARLNHRLLGEARRDGSWRQVEVSQGVLRPGRNLLTLWSDASLADNPNPVLVDQVFLDVEYPG